MSDTLADISLRLNQLTRMRKTDIMRERLEDFLLKNFHRDIFIRLIGVRGQCGWQRQRW